MQSIPILTYHQIAEAPPKGAPFRSLYVSPAAFARQMAMLRLLGYRGVSVCDLLPYLRGEKKGKVVGITFDDGYRNNLVHALPVLQKEGFTSTCYVVSSLLGQTNLWDQALGIAQTPLMTAEELRAWLGGGQEIGAHTRTHANLELMNDQASQAEIMGSKVELEAMLGAKIAQFCYPYGAYRPAHVEQVRAAGYATATTTKRGRAGSASDLFELPRVPVVRATTLPVFLLKLLTGYEDRE